MQGLCGCTCIPWRYLTSFMCFLAMTLAYITRFCLSIAITDMVKLHPRNISAGRTLQECPYDDEGLFNVSTRTQTVRGEFVWDEHAQGMILSSFFWGYVLTQVPGGLLAERWGGKYTLGGAMLVSALCSLLTPWAARSGGPWGLISLRVVMGLGQGFVYPSLNALLAKWAPLEERGRLGSFVFAGANFGNIVSMSVSGLLLSWTGNWTVVFYLYGGVTLGWLAVWQWLGYSRPEDHPSLAQAEAEYLGRYAASVNMKENLPPTPWRQILTSVPLWGLVVAQIGHDWGFFTIITDLPKYMKSVLHFSIAQTGLRSALPYVAVCVMAVVAGAIADCLLTRKICSVTIVRKLFTTVASVGPALGILGASSAGCDKDTVQLCLILGMGLMGFFYSSLKVNCLDLSPNYAGTVMALVNGIGAVSGIITPYLVGLLIPDNTIDQWRQVFFITAGMLVVTNIVYVFTGSGEVQSWNNPVVTSDPADQKAGRFRSSRWRKPWSAKQSWYMDPAPVRPVSLYYR